jgi:tetratricopeptide (TPR) repeat protein
MADRLRPLWDFDDLPGTEQRLRAQLRREESDASRAETLTQLARVEGLRGDFEASDALLREAETLAGPSPVANVRIELERGRMLRSSGDPEAALPLFESAFARARESGEYFLAADAAHMAAIAADPGGLVRWTQQGIELAEAEADAAYWAGPLLNNLGWHHYEQGSYESALDAFERALRVRERVPNRPAEIEIARYAVARTQRALGRAEEAARLLEQCVANSGPDAYFHEELAEAYAELGRSDEASEQAKLALALLAPDDERATRLRELV